MLNRKLFHTLICSLMIAAQFSLQPISVNALKPNSYPHTTHDVPESIVSDPNITNWAIGGDFIYWASPSGLHRTPLHGGTEITLNQDPSGTDPAGLCLQYCYLSADDSGVFYFDQVGNLIYYTVTDRLNPRSLSSPSSPLDATKPFTNGPPIAFDNQAVYWIAKNGGAIYRTPKDSSSGATLVANETITLTALTVDDQNVYWSDGSHVWKKDKSCALACEKVLLTSAGPSNLSVSGAYVYWNDVEKLLGLEQYSGRIRRSKTSTTADFTSAQKWRDRFCITQKFCMVGDLSGDGKDDIVEFDRNDVFGGHGSPVGLARSEGSQFEGGGSVEQVRFCVYDQQCSVGDFDGDGKTDLMVFARESLSDLDYETPGSVWVALSAGPHIGEIQKWNDSFCRGNQICAVADVNGDGKDDLVAFDHGWPTGLSGNVYVALSTGSSFAAGTLWQNQFCYAESLHCILGDFNGDGRADIASIAPGANADEGIVKIALSDGTQFNEILPGGFYSRAICNHLGDTCISGDFDGDGLDDIASLVQGGSGAITVDLACCSSANLVSLKRELRVWRDDLCHPNEICVSGDFNGDHTSDTVIFRRNIAPSDAPGIVDVALSNGTAETLYPIVTKSNRKHKFTPLVGDQQVIGSLTTDGVYMAWTESARAQLVVRKVDSSDPAVSIADVGNWTNQRPFLRDGYVYFRDDHGLRRISVSASPLIHIYDFVADNWEVTQGIQNLQNDVPLVANKSTFVRFYGHLASGGSANSVEAQLFGTRDGKPLPGSPLYPIDGIKKREIGKSLSSGYERANMDSSWLFKLPPEWISTPQFGSSTIKLKAVINSNNAYTEVATDNNSLTGDFTFTYQPPECVIFAPVSTYLKNGNGALAPLPTRDDAFWMMLDRAKQLWPVPDIWPFFDNDPVMASVAITEPVGFTRPGPYLVNSDDMSEMLGRLYWRRFWSSDPEACWRVGAASRRTHLVGMVYANSQGDDSLTGKARNSSNVAFFRMPALPAIPDIASLVASGKSYEDIWKLYSQQLPEEFRAAANASGRTLAHEIAHNLGRKHTPDPPPGSTCGQTSAGGSTDSEYPYPSDKIYDPTASNLDVVTHFGFDSELLMPVNPYTSTGYHVGDLMSYCNVAPDIGWTSDYTWKALIDAGYLRPVIPSETTAFNTQSESIRKKFFRASDISGSEQMVAVTGIYTPSTNQVALDFA